MIYWLTGQPGSGKTVLGDMLKTFLENSKNKKDTNQRYKVYRIDGDEMRDLFTNKDYTIKGRITNVDAAQKIAHYLHNQGHDVVVSLVSPYLDQREEFKDTMQHNIQEIFVHYDVNTVFRGREQYHVLQFQKPDLDYININTTYENPNESLLRILKQIGVDGEV